jgi:SMI1-KNR4 cell-wall
MERLVRAISIISEKEAFECLAGGANPEQIASLEVQLGISFPEEYRWFLRNYGYVSWFGHCLLGFSPNDRDHDTLLATNKMRATKLPKGFHSMPAYGNIVMKYAGGGYYFLFSKGTELEGSVELFSDELGGQPSDRWESFAEFVEHFSQY